MKHDFVSRGKFKNSLINLYYSLAKSNRGKHSILLEQPIRPYKKREEKKLKRCINLPLSDYLRNPLKVFIKFIMSNIF